MARTCLCDRWLTRAAADMGFRALPALARLLWFDILAAAMVAAEKGRLRFPCPVSDAVSRLVSRSETDIETDLAALVDLGWLDLDDDGRGVSLPGVQAATARVEAARSNGLRGGRPRKGETREAARDRRQGTMMLPIAGGTSETHGTETEPNGESSRAAAKPIAIEAKQAADAREETNWVALGMELGEIAGLDAARGRWTCQDVQGWLAAGATPDMIRDVVRTVAARPRRDGRPIGSLKFFDAAVRDAIDRAAPPPPPAARPTSGYEAAFRRWKESGAQGAPPRLAEWQASQAMAS